MGPPGSCEGSVGVPPPAAQWGPLDAPDSYPAWVPRKVKDEGDRTGTVGDSLSDLAHPPPLA